MRIEPVITEKSLQLAKQGKYTFKVDKSLTKYEIKDLVERSFNVHVLQVSTITLHGEKKRTLRGKKKVIKPAKKTVVKLKEKEKIDIFEVKEQR